MKKQRKSKKLIMPEYIGGYSTKSEIFSMSREEFRDYSIGKLALAIGRGEFQQEVLNITDQAFARGMHYQLAKHIV